MKRKEGKKDAAKLFRKRLAEVQFISFNSWHYYKYVSVASGL